MPVNTDSIANVRRERNRTALLRQKIREALDARGTNRSKRAVRLLSQNEREGS